MLSQYAAPSDVIELFSEGVEGLGYLLKERVARVEELVAALQAVCAGGSSLDPLVVQALVSMRTAQKRSAWRCSLTESWMFYARWRRERPMPR